MERFKQLLDELEARGELPREGWLYLLSHPECQREDPEFDAWCDRVIAALEGAKF